MKRLLVWIIGLSFLGTVTMAALAGAYPLWTAPLRTQTWAPLPLICIGIRCLTYRGIFANVPESGQQVQPSDLLTRLARREALRQVARSTGLGISYADIQTALKTIDETMRREPELGGFVLSTYGSSRTAQLQEGMNDLLLSQKLSASGIKDIWSIPETPAVYVLHWRYRWDDLEHRVSAR